MKIIEMKDELRRHFTRVNEQAKAKGLPALPDRCRAWNRYEPLEPIGGVHTVAILTAGPALAKNVITLEAMNITLDRRIR